MRYKQPWNTQFGRPVDDPNAPYINANPQAGIEGSVPPAESIEYPQREIVTATQLAGFVPSDEDQWRQLTRGIRQGTAYGTATVISGGDPNMLYINLDPPLDQYRAGLRLWIKIPVENDGPVAVNIDSLGLRNVTRANGAVLSAADLRAGMVAELVDDGNVFQLVNFQGFTADITNENTYIVNVPYCVDLGSANHIIAPFSPPISSLSAGFFCFVKIAAANTGKTFISVNGLPEVELIRTDLLALGPRDIIAGMVCGMVYDGAKFQMVSAPASLPRDLVAPMTYYVSPTGSDANDGLTPATAFRHIMYAKDQMMRWNNRNTEFTIKCADGLYEEIVILPTINGSGYANLVGNDSNPQNCVIWDNLGSSSQTACITVVGENYRIHGFKVVSNAGTGMQATIGTVYFWNMEFGPCGNSHLSSAYGGRVLGGKPDGPGFLRVSGAAQYHLNCSGSSLLGIGPGANIYPTTLYITAPISFTAFAAATNGATLGVAYSSIEGAGNVTSGYKYIASNNAQIQSTLVLPGTLPGFTNNGGIYQGP